MIISVLGRPGSGKTTLAKILAARSGYGLITGGDVARELARTDDEVREALDAGLIAPKEKMNEAMAKKIEPYNIFDGYPRYEGQLWQLQARARTYRTSPLFIYLACSESTANSRLLLRRRSDDNAEAMRQRQMFFETETLRMINTCINPADLLTFNGSLPADVVALTALNKLARLYAPVFG